MCVQSLLEGKTEELPARVCDVRDVARAHVRAIEEPSASGRHIISQPNNIPSQFVVDILRKRFPNNTKLHGKDGDSSPIIDNSKVTGAHNIQANFLARLPTTVSCILVHTDRSYVQHQPIKAIELWIDFHLTLRAAQCYIVIPCMPRWVLS